MDWLSKVVGALPKTWRWAGTAVLLGFAIGGGTAESIGAYQQVGENTESVEVLQARIDSMGVDVHELNHKIDTVLCILVLEEGVSPLTCAPGGQR